MNIGSLLFLIVFLILDHILQKRCPRFYKRIQLPINIVFSVLVAGYCGLLLYAICDVLSSNVSSGDKVFFVIFIGINIAIFVAMIILTWLRWARDRKNNQ